MKMFAESYKGLSRTEVGPMLLTRSVQKYFKTKSIEMIKNESLTVLPMSAFYPIKWYEKNKLWPKEPKSFDYWANLFQNSSMVHFYGSLTNKFIVEDDPSHEAYAVLGPKYCPLSYKSSKNF